MIAVIPIQARDMFLVIAMMGGLERGLVDGISVVVVGGV